MEGPPDTHPMTRQVTVTLPDGSSRSVPAGTTVRTSRRRSRRGWPKAALAAVVDDRLVDLTIRSSATPASASSPTRSRGAVALPPQHGAPAGGRGHALFPGTQCGIGPAIDEGFFYDFVVERPFVPEDLEAIERRCASWPRRTCPTSGRSGPREAPRRSSGARRAAEGAADRGEDGRAADVSCYTIKDRETFVDFCVGPHVPSTGRLKAFKLLNTSNAYWKGDAKNQPMQRIYGTAFFSDKDLKAHLQRIEEAKKRDHRKLGATSGCSCSTRGRRAPPSGSARARRSTTRSPTTCARCSSRPATSR
jgi:threonyl-tRNA synthetase